jgi:chromosome segregation ATPase
LKKTQDQVTKLSEMVEHIMGSVLQSEVKINREMDKLWAKSNRRRDEMEQLTKAHAKALRRIDEMENSDQEREAQIVSMRDQLCHCVKDTIIGIFHPRRG